MAMKITWYRQGLGDRQPYLLCPVRDMDDLCEVAEFVKEGFGELEELLGITWEDFTDQIIKTIKSTRGLLAVFFSKNHKPLGFVMVVDDSVGSLEQTALIYAAYSNGRYAGAANEAVTFAEEWATKQGFTKLRAVSRRMNGAALKLFKKRLGFRPAYIVFEKGL